MFVCMCINILVKCNFCPSQVRSCPATAWKFPFTLVELTFTHASAPRIYYIVLFHYYNIMNLSIIFSQTMVNKGLCTFDSLFKSNQNVKMVTKNAG